jgi:copper/silver efflux system protein
VAVDPNRLLAYDVTLPMIEMAIKNSNLDVGGGAIEMAETEFVVRSRGYIQSWTTSSTWWWERTNAAPPSCCGILPRCAWGRRCGAASPSSTGKGRPSAASSSCAFGENALKTIDNVKRKLEELKPGLPEGVEIVPVYDRSGLIQRAVSNLKEKLSRRASSSPW